MTAVLRQINKNHLLPPSDTITHKELFQLYYILSNTSPAKKPQEPPTFKLPVVFTQKPISAPPRVSPSITQNFHNISPTTQKHCRDLWATEHKSSPKTSLFSSPSPKFNSNPHPNTYSLDNTNYAFTTINLSTKLQHLVQQNINRASDPFINPLLKINAVLDTTTGKLLNTNN